MSGARGVAPAGNPAVHRWGRYEVAVPLALPPGADPLRDVRLTAGFSGPSGQRHAAPGFWDGADTWRVRFAPDEVGPWTYTLALEGTAGGAGAPPGGAFACVPYEGDNPFYRHGPVRRYGPDRRRLAHADGTPWLYLADTVWNGPIRSTPAEWDSYVAARKAQGFTAAQFVATQWRTAPDGGPDGPAWVGGERVSGLNPGFFRRLDARLDALTAAGIAGVPVLLWAIRGGTNNESNPGNVLSEADCALLAGYQVARWHAHPVLWILNGDGKYLGEEGARWRRIGRAVFGATDGAPRAPAMVHPGGQTWVGDEFAAEPWLDVVGYQSGHGDDERAWRWIVEGPPATAWRDLPDKVVMNLESPLRGPPGVSVPGTAPGGARAPGQLLEPARLAHRRGDLRRTRRLGLGRRHRPARRPRLDGHPKALAGGPAPPRCAADGAPGPDLHLPALVAAPAGAGSPPGATGRDGRPPDRHRGARSRRPRRPALPARRGLRPPEHPPARRRIDRYLDRPAVGW